MKNELWHLYYSGTDIVDQNNKWRESSLGTIICRACGNYMPNGTACADLVVDQRIPKNTDMFSTGYLSPVIISNKIHSRISGVSDAYLNFGRVYVSGQYDPLDTHYVLIGKKPWITLRGDKPSFLDGKPVMETQDRICTECGARFGRGRGAKYINKADIEMPDISWTEFGGILIKNHIMDLFSGTKLKNIRVEKIEVRNGLK